jgi:carbonic anhydrase
MLDAVRDTIVRSHGATGRDAERAMETAAVKVSLANLRSFPFVAEREAAGLLKLRGAFFAIADGILHVLDETSGEFAAVA